MPVPPLSQHIRQRNRERRLLRHDGAGELVELVGVVHPAFPLAQPSPFSVLWQLRLTLLAWQAPSCSVEFGEMTVIMQASKREVEAAAAPVQPFVVMRLRLRMADDEPDLNPFAVLIEPPVRDTDRDMARIAQELQRPVTFEDPALGTFTLDRRANWFEANTAWGGRQVQLSLSMDDRVDREVQIERARKLWAELDAWFGRVIEFAIADLLPIKNRAWLDENQPPIDAGEFERAMRIESITIHSDGSVDFWFDDGDLFWGHAIMVACTPTGTPTQADLCG